MTLLVIDSGNTRIKWGLWQGRGFIARGSVLTARAAELADALHTLARPQRVIGSNVAGEKVALQIAAALAPWQLEPKWIASRREQCGVVSRYAHPEQLGTDRWAALIGAFARQPGACLVVNVGTAVTVDALTGSGEFVGGLIVPGIDLMARSLATGTAGLPLEAGQFETFPTSTANAICSGAIQAVCGAVERMEQALAAASQSEPRIILGGGAGDVIAQHLAREVIHAANLVLEGLVIIAHA